MNEATKITFSADEISLFSNAEIILTKQVIIQKIIKLFGNILPELKQLLECNRPHLPQEVFMNPAKISKGEQYQMLPYVMLDYPRFFGKSDSIAFRTFFWWGNFFSVSMLVSGQFKNEIVSNLLFQFNTLKESDYWICIAKTQWEHHFEEDNYLKLTDCTQEQFAAILDREHFVKIAKKMPLQQWQDASIFITATFKEMIQLMQPLSGAQTME